jgi:hypothetical protein
MMAKHTQNQFFPANDVPTGFVQSNRIDHHTYDATPSILILTYRVARFFVVQYGENVPNDHEIYHSAIKYTKWAENLPNGLEIYQNLPLQEPPKFTQIGIFVLKTNHLATLLSYPSAVQYAYRWLVSSFSSPHSLHLGLGNFAGLRSSTRYISFAGIYII